MNSSMRSRKKRARRSRAKFARSWNASSKLRNSPACRSLRRSRSGRIGARRSAFKNNMLYAYLGTDRKKVRDAMDSQIAKLKGHSRVHITDAHSLADLDATLLGGGMF